LRLTREYDVVASFLCESVTRSCSLTKQVSSPLRLRVHTRKSTPQQQIRLYTTVLQQVTICTCKVQIVI